MLSNNMIIGIHNWRIQLNQENKNAFKDMAFYLLLKMSQEHLW